MTILCDGCSDDQQPHRCRAPVLACSCRRFACIMGAERTESARGEATSFTYDRLAEILRELGPIPARPVIILASWLPRDRIIKRPRPATEERGAIEEWRIHPATFQALKASEPMPEHPHLILDSLWEIRVEPEIETMPSRELIEEMIGPQVRVEDAIESLGNIYSKRLRESMREDYQGYLGPTIRVNSQGER